MPYFRIITVIFGLLVTGLAHAQTEPPNTEWEKRQNADERLTAFGDDLLGDGIDPHTGSISFQHTDVSLPGNSALPVTIQRRRKQGAIYSRTTDVEFGDWEIVAPRIYAVSAASNPWTGNRCTVPFNQQFTQVQQGSRYHQGREYSDGVFVDAPGSGAQTMLSSPAGGMWPASAKHVTSGNWYFTCGSASDGGQGFIGHAPNGDTYRFDKFYSHDAPVQGAAYKPRLQRKRYILAATRVTDAVGNYVDYTYDSSNRLTKIKSNDLREITLTYSGSLISSVTANNRTWSYGYRESNFQSDMWDSYPYHNYTNKVLSSVTLPDGRAWSFNLDNMTARPAPSDECQRHGFSFDLTHPSGVTGTFKVKDQDHRYTAAAYIAQWGNCMFFDGEPDRETTGGSGAPPPTEYKNTTSVMSVIEKKLTGSNIPTATWTYDYENDLSTTTPAAAERHNWTKVSGPGVHLTYYHNWVTEPFGGKVVKTETRDAPSSAILQTVETDYVVEAAVGNSFTNIYSNAGDAVTPTRTIETTTSRGTNIWHNERSYETNHSSSTYSFGSPIQTQTYSNRWNSAAPRITVTEYEHNTSKWILGLPKKTTQNGRVMTEASYSNLGQLTEQKQYGEVVYSVSYYTSGAQNGQIEYVDDAIGRRTKAFNWKRGTPQHIERTDGTDIYQTVDDNGWVTSSTDAKGYVTNYTHDTMGRLTQYNPAGPWDNTNINYTFGNGVVQTITKGSAETTITYDAMYRPVLEKTQDLATSWVSYVNTQYDDLGRIAFKSQPSISQYEDEGMTYSYDALGRLKNTVETASGATTTHDYLSNHRHRIIQPSGDWTDYYSYGYDGPDSKDYSHIYNYGDGVYHRKTMLYKNIWGQMIRLRQFGNLNNHGGDKSQYFYYDARQRLCRHYVPEHGATKYQYDDAGQITAYAKGQSNSGCGAVPSVPEKVSMTYDDMGRVTLTDFTDSDTPDIARTYDDNGNVLTVNRGTGEAAVNWTYTYNDINLLTSESLNVSESLNIDGRSFNSAYQYNNSGHMTLRTMPSGRTLTYLPDGLGRTRVVYNNGAWMVDNVSWHPNGSVAAMRHRNGQMFTQTLNNRLLPERLLSVKGANTALDQTLTYDINGRVSSILDGAITGNSRTYDYDALGQLTFAAGPWGMGSYDYDSLGNLRSKTLGSRTVDLAYDITRNRVSQSVDSGPSGTRTIAYDSRGNVTSLGSLAMTYDMSDQPTIVTGTADGVGAANGNYLYDGNLKRVVSVVNGKTIYNVYDASGALIHVDADTDNKVTDYVTGPMGTLARITNGTVTYLHPDHLGSAQSGTTASGTVAWTEQYTPFGEELQSRAANDNLAGFTGHIKDKATGLNYMQARYYDPVIGRFLSIDPVEFSVSSPGMFGRYTYTHNDPVNMIDPDGEEAYGLNAEAKVVWGVGIKVSAEVAYDTESKEVRIRASFGEHGGAKAKGSFSAFVEPSSETGNTIKASSTAIAQAAVEVKAGGAALGIAPEASIKVETPTLGVDGSEATAKFDAGWNPSASMRMVNVDDNGRTSFTVGGGLGASVGVDHQVDASFSIPDAAQFVKDIFN